jgi:hypothetical protein
LIVDAVAEKHAEVFERVHVVERSRLAKQGD